VSDYHEQLSFPGYQAASVRLYGTGSNPMEWWFARIRWDVQIETNYSSPDYVTAYSNWGTQRVSLPTW
jgi:hypothetical protein